MLEVVGSAIWKVSQEFQQKAPEPKSAGGVIRVHLLFPYPPMLLLLPDKNAIPEKLLLRTPFIAYSIPSLLRRCLVNGQLRDVSNTPT